MENVAHGRDSGTNKPHHPKHGESNTLYPERVNDQTVAPHVDRVNAKEQVLSAHTPHIAAYNSAGKVPAEDCQGLTQTLTKG